MLIGCSRLETRLTLLQSSQNHCLTGRKQRLSARVSRFTNHKTQATDRGSRITNHQSPITRSHPINGQTGTAGLQLRRSRTKAGALAPEAAPFERGNFFEIATTYSPMRNTLEISGILQATIATQKQALDAADTRERDRAVTLKDTLAKIEALKRQAQTPAQILSELPQFLPLPQPSTFTSPQSVPRPARQGTAQSEKPACAGKKGCTRLHRRPQPPPQQTTRPGSNPPALHDTSQAARSPRRSTDNAAKLKALTRERDAAVATGKGGTFWQRLHRNALWFVVGAGAGAARCAAPRGTAAKPHLSTLAANFHELRTRQHKPVWATASALALFQKSSSTSGSEIPLPLEKHASGVCFCCGGRLLA
jgi:hypothetical protein